MEDAVDEFLGALLARGAEYLLGRAVLDDHAACAEDHAGGNVLGKPHVVGDDHHRHVLGGKYSGQTVKVGGDELLVMKEDDLFAVVEK